MVKESEDAGGSPVRASREKMGIRRRGLGAEWCDARWTSRSVTPRGAARRRGFEGMARALALLIFLVFLVLLLLLLLGDDLELGADLREAGDAIFLGPTSGLLKRRDALYARPDVALTDAGAFRPEAAVNRHELVRMLGRAGDAVKTRRKSLLDIDVKRPV